MDNAGNGYRTRNMVIAAAVMIAVALGLLVWGIAGFSVVSTLGVVLLVIGFAIFAVGVTYSGVPDKFGPSEKMYRVAGGLVLVLLGIVCVITNYNASWVVYVAVLIIGLALIGLSVGLINSKHAKF